jgi:SAM-dependent methyltransferase
MSVAASYRLHPRWESLESLVDAHAAPDGSIRLDLGCGYVKPEGFIGIDDLSGEGAQFPDEQRAPDLFLDLNSEPLPFAEGSCAEVRSSHFLEHSDLDHIFDEAFRVLRPGGVFFFVVPYANSAQGMFPGHHIFLTERFFHENLHFQRLFRIVEEEFFPSDVWEGLPRLVKLVLPFDRARQLLFNVCHQMAIRATPRKDAPGAGPPA